MEEYSFIPETFHERFNNFRENVSDFSDETEALNQYLRVLNNIYKVREVWIMKKRTKTLKIIEEYLRTLHRYIFGFGKDTQPERSLWNHVIYQGCTTYNLEELVEKCFVVGNTFTPEECNIIQEAKSECIDDVKALIDFCNFTEAYVRDVLRV